MEFYDDWEEKEKNAQSNSRWALGGIALFGIGAISEFALSLAGLGLLTLLAMIYPCYAYMKARDEYERRIAHRQKMTQAFHEAQEQITVPQDSDLICEGHFYLWEEDNKIKIFATKWETQFFQLRTIPVADLIFYSREGEIHTETHGYGGGSSYSMITGWNGKIDPIVISTRLKDNRKTILLYRDDGKEYSLELGHDDYLVLKKRIPEKDIDVVTKVKNEDKTNTLEDKLKALKTLYEQDLITKEEFETRRERLLQEVF